MYLLMYILIGLYFRFPGVTLDIEGIMQPRLIKTRYNLSQNRPEHLIQYYLNVGRSRYEGRKLNEGFK